MRATDGVARFQAEFVFQWGEEGFEVGHAESIGLMDDVGESRIDQGGKHNGAHAVGFALGIDAGDGILGFFGAVEEGDAYLPEFNFFELREQAVTQGFDSQASAVGDEEYGALDRGRHGVLFQKPWNSMSRAEVIASR